MQRETERNLERMKKLRENESCFQQLRWLYITSETAVTLFVTTFLMISEVISINEIVAVCISHFPSFISQKYQEPNVMASAAVSPEINFGPVFHSLGAMEFVIIFGLERSLSVSLQSCSFVTVKSCAMGC